MKVDHYTGEVYHHGKWHKPGCSSFLEEDEYGTPACNCDDEPEEEPEEEEEEEEEETMTEIQIIERLERTIEGLKVKAIKPHGTGFLSVVEIESAKPFPFSLVRSDEHDDTVLLKCGNRFTADALLEHELKQPTTQEAAV